MRIDIVVYDGVDELDAVGPFEVLRSASEAGAPFDVRLVTRQAQVEVVGAQGLRFRVDGVIEPGAADILLVAGGGWLTKSASGAWSEAEQGHMLRSLQAAADGATVVAGVCTGVMLLARAGLVGQRRATTHHGAWNDLAAAGAVLVQDRVVDDGSLLTAAGVTSGIDLALWIVERFASPSLADVVANHLEYQRQKPATPS